MGPNLAARLISHCPDILELPTLCGKAQCLFGGRQNGRGKRALGTGMDVGVNVLQDVPLSERK